MFFRRTYYDAEPIYVREQTPNWYQQLPATNEAIQRVLADFAPGRTALEIGCGGAWLGRFLLQQGAKRYVGFDFSETAILYAEKRIGKFRGAEVFVGDALAETSYRGTFDLIVAHQFAQCLIGPDRAKWLENVRRAIDPERGVFVLSSIVGIPPGLRPTLRPGSRVNRLKNRYFADDTELKSELESAGFSIAETWHPEKNMAIYAAKPR